MPGNIMHVPHKKLLYFHGNETLDSAYETWGLEKGTPN